MNTSRERWAGLAAVNLAAVIFGTTALFGKLGVSPFWIVAGRGFFAAVILLAVGLASRAAFRFERRNIFVLAVTVVALAAHWVTFFISVQDAGVAVATLTFATFPLVTLLIDSTLRRRRPSVIETASSITIIFAVWLLVGRGLPETAGAQQGALVGLLSAVCFAIFSVGSQRLGQGVDIIALSFYQNAGVALLLLPTLPFVAPAPHGLDWLFIAGLGIVATALMHQLYFYALERLPASVCGGFVALEPVYAIIFAAALFSEAIGPAVIVSGILIVGASILMLVRPGGARHAEQLLNFSRENGEHSR